MRTKDSNFVIINLISSLVIVFIFILTYYFNDRTVVVPMETEEVNILSGLDRNVIYRDLIKEFNGDLARWGAEIDRDNLAVRFNTDRAFFKIGEANIEEDFKNILQEFFPKYIAVLEKYKDDVEEIRIEGHTDAGWNRFFTATGAYIKNMKLSQERTFNVFEYCLHLPNMSEKEWLKSVLATAGLSSSHSIANSPAREDGTNSNRRVEFKVVLKLQERALKVVIPNDAMEVKNQQADLGMVGDNLLDNFDMKSGTIAMGGVAFTNNARATN